MPGTLRYQIPRLLAQFHRHRHRHRHRYRHHRSRSTTRIAMEHTTILGKIINHKLALRQEVVGLISCGAMLLDVMNVSPS